MDRWVGKIAVVTGASSGIGLATSQSLIRKGMTVIGLARRKTKMENEMKNVEGNENFYALKCDLTIEENVNQAFQWIKESVGTPQILVNNAGIFYPGKIVVTSKTDWEKIFDTNVIGMLMCTKHFLDMIKNTNLEGHIVNVNSIGGHRVYTIGEFSQNVYNASKFAMKAVSETLRKELMGDKIRVTNLSPGYVKTKLIETGCLAKPDLIKDIINPKLIGFPALNSEDIAESIIYIVASAPHIEITELTIIPMEKKPEFAITLS